MRSYRPHDKSTSTGANPRYGRSKQKLYATVFLAGAVVMMLELLGTRIIAPFYGNSLVVWTSLISVTLVALAMGYFIGGWVADRWEGKGLNIVLLCATLFVFLIPFTHTTILAWSEPLGIRLGALLSAVLLFLPPLLFLGILAPVAVRGASIGIDKIGSVAGSLYAVSTLGSVIGTLLLGFLLFPLFGSSDILLASGTVLLFCALLVTTRLNLTLTVLLVINLSVLSAEIWSKHLATDQRIYNGFRLVEAKESLYGWVRVLDNRQRDARLLASDASVIGAASISSNENLLAYQTIVDLIPKIRPGMKRGLLIGQGAGHMAMRLQDAYGIATDTIEIDPVVDDLARRFFGFHPSGTAIIGDGRYVIRNIQGPYDLIIHDCFTGGSEPSHLLTLETLKLLKEKLSDGGIVALNFVGMAAPPDHLGLASVSRTFARVFPEVAIYQSEPGDFFNDYIFLGSQQPFLEYGRLGGKDAEWLASRRVTLNDQDGTILTDDYNPLESLQISKSERYRKLVRGWLGDGLIVN